MATLPWVHARGSHRGHGLYVSAQQTRAAVGCKPLLGNATGPPRKLVPANQEQRNRARRVYRQRRAGVIVNAKPAFEPVTITHLVTQTRDAVDYLNKTRIHLMNRLVRSFVSNKAEGPPRLTEQTTEISGCVWSLLTL